ncbi:hypothetical protein D918_08407, partial [Trichuris suis]
LSDSLFRQLCDQNDEDFHRLLLHTEVRWLSKGACLTRFYNLFTSLLEFFEKTHLFVRTQRNSKVTLPIWQIFTQNSMNLQFQGDALNLIRARSVISAFVSKLLFFRNNLSRGEFYDVPNFCEVRNKAQMNEDVEVYWRHLELLPSDFVERFHDILDLEIPGRIV